MNRVNKNIRPIFFNVCLLFSILTLATSCNDSFVRQASNEAQLDLKILGNQFDTESKENDVYTVRMIDFYVDTDGNAGVNNLLIYNKSTESVTGKSVTFPTIPGEHTLYFIANAENRAVGSNAVSPALSKVLASVTTEDELKKVLLEYSLSGSEALPTQPLLMSAKYTKTIEEGLNSLDICLQHNSVKVSYTLDVDTENPALADGKFELRSLKFNNLAKTSYLIAQETPVAEPNTFNTDHLPKLADKNVWPQTGVFYLPECIYSDDAKNDDLFAQMEITAGFVGSAANYTYTINLIGDGSEGDKDPKNEITPRGRHYQISAKIKNVGELVETKIVITPWTVASVDIEFGNKMLSLSKLSASITSLLSDSILYTTNASSFDWEVIEYPTSPYPIVLEKNAGGTALIAKPNKDFVVREGTALEGTVKVKLKADNLHKIIEVKYDFTPILIVRPVEIVIDLNTGVSTAVTNYITNIGGITTGAVYGLTDGLLSVSPSSSATNEGVINLAYKGDVNALQTSKIYYFDVAPLNNPGGVLKPIKVGVKIMPKLDGWLIYFKAVNDRVGKPLGDNAIWERSDTDNDIAHVNGWNNNRNTYIYTQDGAKAGADNVWRFVEKNAWPGDQLTPDPNNAGWYYYQLKNILDYTKGAKYPVPGTTLVMFSALNTHHNDRHRYPYNEEPGIPLFDFVDHEGWFIYDPTVGYYEFYDSKPEIFEATYTICYKPTGNGEPKFRWYKGYASYTLMSNEWNAGGFNYSTMTYVPEGDYYKADIKLMAWEENKSKAITIEFYTPEKGIHKANDLIYDGIDCFVSKDQAVGTYNPTTQKWSKGTPSSSLPSLPTLLPGKRRIFFYNTDSWSGLNIYSWEKVGSTNTPKDGIWPGSLMNLWYGNWYYYDISNVSNWIVISEKINDNRKTGDIQITDMNTNEQSYKNGWIK